MFESARSTFADGYYVWESQSKAVTVLLNLQILDRLKEYAQPAGEIGGFLLGRSEAGDTGQVVTTIDDFELVECSQQRGANYDLNERDRKRFARRVSRPLAGIDPKLAPIGFFRTHRRPDIYLAAPDIGLMQSYFPSPAAVALVVKPDLDSVGGLFVREAGVLHPQPQARFPFNREQLEQGEFTILKIPGRKAVAWTTPRPTKSAWALRWWWAAAGVIVCALALLGRYGTRSRYPEPVHASAGKIAAEMTPPLQPAAVAEMTRGTGSADRSIAVAAPPDELRPARTPPVKAKGKKARRAGKRKRRPA